MTVGEEGNGAVPNGPASCLLYTRQRERERENENERGTAKP